MVVPTSFNLNDSSPSSKKSEVGVSETVAFPSEPITNVPSELITFKSVVFVKTYATFESACTLVVVKVIVTSSPSSTEDFDEDK